MSSVANALIGWIRIHLASAFVLASIGSQGFAYTPLDPEIEQLVDGGLRYLERSVSSKADVPPGRAFQSERGSLCCGATPT